MDSINNYFSIQWHILFLFFLLSPMHIWQLIVKKLIGKLCITGCFCNQVGHWVLCWLKGLNRDSKTKSVFVFKWNYSHNIFIFESFGVLRLCIFRKIWIIWYLYKLLKAIRKVTNLPFCPANSLQFLALFWPHL